MSDPNFLRELVIVLTATIAIVFIFQKLRLPNIVGFLLTGVIIGPHGFQLIQSVDQVESLAEIGVVLLLFTIGLEFSLETILSVQRRVVWAGLLQVVLTTLVVFSSLVCADRMVPIRILNGLLSSAIWSPRSAVKRGGFSRLSACSIFFIIILIGRFVTNWKN